MRILLVEDNVDFAQTIEKAIRAIDGCDLTWKRSKAGAISALNEEHFDVVILDRRIPTEDDILDDHQDHGWAVFQSIIKLQPGTSVWFLTGTVDADFPTELLNSHGRRGDIHQCGREDPVYRVVWKHKLPVCIAAVRAFRGEIERTDAVHLVHVGTPANLRAQEVRLLKLFGRSHSGASVEVELLQGGLSNARVFRVSVFNAAGSVAITSVAKIGSIDDIAVERLKYRSEIVKLANGAFPPVMAELDLGAADLSGIFYQIVGHEIRSLFDELTADPASASLAVRQLWTDQSTWLGVSQTERISVASVRRSLIGDVALERVADYLNGIDISLAERVEVDVARCVQHRDMHCGNVLFDANGRPMVIDYPETGRSFASLDPVSLELSAIFHKDAPDWTGWPSEHQAEQWPDLDAFCEASVCEQFVRACRAWAVEVAASEQEVLAVAYGYALRQLKYDDTDKVLARAVIRACIAGLLADG